MNSTTAEPAPVSGRPGFRFSSVVGKVVQWYFTPFIYLSMGRAGRRAPGSGGYAATWRSGPAAAQSLLAILVWSWLSQRGPASSSSSAQPWDSVPPATQGASGLWTSLAVWSMFALLHRFGIRPRLQRSAQAKT